MPLSIVKIVRLTRDFDSDGLITACFSPDGKRIAFNGRRAGDNCDALYIMDRDGSSLVRLFCGDSPICHPSFSPDGASICFNAGPSIYEYDIAADRNRRVAGDAADAQGSPVYTRDGARILYCSPSGLKLVSRPPPIRPGDTASPAVVALAPAARPVTTHPADRDPAYSPDGKQLALVGDMTQTSYVRDRVARPGGTAIYVMATDNPQRRPVVTGASESGTRNPDSSFIVHPSSFSSVAHPCWSPDMRFLAYDRTTGRQTGIHVWSFATGRETAFTDDNQQSSIYSLQSALAPSFSPDGRAIVFTRRSATGQNVFLGRLAPVTPDSETASVGLEPESAAAPTETVSVDRARYKIVVFAADEDQAGEFLKTLIRKGYTNPGSYVTSPPTNHAVVKHNGAPAELVQELIGFAQEYLTVALSPEIEPRLPATTIYINLP